ncbi:hypothetical protein L484_024829 [Morus notabilis]|uniref:Uncharacterized protein n=1 Tax=Morus notabilis TaxID=981085 RepID=W9RJ24_9ROSA|nr:hypothetical protein L484_024829 [Morus notabilis]
MKPTEEIYISNADLLLLIRLQRRGAYSVAIPKTNLTKFVGANFLLIVHFIIPYIQASRQLKHALAFKRKVALASE